LSITIQRTSSNDADFDVEDAIVLGSGLANANPGIGKTKV